MKIRWFSQIRTKLFASLILLASCTVVACAVSVWLFDGFSSLFSRTIRRDFATFGSMVRLQEEASQLVQLTGSLSASVRQGQLAAVLDAITAGRDKAAYAVVVLHRDVQMVDQVDDIAAKLDVVFAALKTVEELSAKRIAAVEQRIATGSRVLPALNHLEEAFTGQGDVPGLVDFRRAAALSGVLLSEAALTQTVDQVHTLRTLFDVEAKVLDRMAPTVAAEAPEVERTAKALIALGRGAGNLFDLRERELQTIALEAQAMRPVKEAAAALSAEFGRIVEEKRHDLDETMRNSAARIEATRLFLIIVATGSVLPFLILALVYVGRSVAGRLRRLAVAMSALANGDTRIEVPTAGAHDEIGEMAQALQFFKRQTIGAQQLAQEVTDSIRQVALAAGQATSAIGQVSGGANTQLTALRHVANGLQQSADAITLVTANTHSARERAQQMADLVEHGRTEMAGMVAAVNAIAESSAQVSKFVDDIARIASQTNMLSLNAEIEAARAGENGKGFTVVAEEVGKLADSSAALATEIAAQIRNAIQQAEHGVASASLVNENIQMIAASVAESDRLAQSIAAAMEQQQTNVAEINGKMGELTGIGQANASAASEISTTMQDLSRLAEETRAKVAQFKMTDNDASGLQAAVGT
ncbi:MAG TPA: methyl-accepting chemotaxis protein [Reyranella sp.]|nr:methyl-accepting chemotaxis protein [Reyranella sp.]